MAKCRNFVASFLQITATVAANTEFAVPHGLHNDVGAGIIPSGAFVVRQNAAGNLYQLMSSSANPLLTNFIGAWEFENAGTLGLDSGANALTFTNNGATQNASGKVGSCAATVRASSQYLDHVDAALLKTAGDWTWAAWVYLASLPAAANLDFIEKGNNTGGNQNYFTRYTTSSNRFLGGFFASDSSGYKIATANSFGAASTATWYFVVNWFDSTAQTINIQVNNDPNWAADSVATAGKVPIQTTDAVAFGRAGAFNGNYWDGRFDQIMFWKRVLTAAERATLYNSGAGVTYATISAPIPSALTPWTTTNAYLTSDVSGVQYYVIFFA